MQLKIMLKLKIRYDGLIGSRIRTYDWYQNQWPWMTLNGRNVTLAAINKIYGARHKNFNEDRSMLSAAKCRPMILVARNIKHMQIFAGVPSESRRRVQ